MRYFIFVALLFFVQEVSSRSSLRKTNYERHAELIEARRAYAADIDDINEEETILKEKMRETPFEGFKSFCESSLEKLFALKKTLDDIHADIENRHQEKEAS
jgi:hypothetical protein